MYLSRMTLNPVRRGTRRLVGDPQAMHAAVMSLFPPGMAESDNGEGRVLWRLDRDESQLCLYVASPERPSFEVMQEQAGWSAHPTDVTRSYEPLLDRLTVGQEYAFRLTANPVHTVTDDHGRKRRFGHVTVAQQEGWFLEKCPSIGIQVRSGVTPDSPWNDLIVRERGIVQFRRGNGIVTLSRATYEGSCRVVDPALLRGALCRGVGRAKGYGCGLLTLADRRNGDAADSGRSSQPGA